MFRYCVIILLLLLAASTVFASSVLDDYIRFGLENNLLLQQEQFELEKNLQVLKEAKGMLMPALSFEARFSLAGGGRTIEFPVGDIVNPIQQTLNQLLAYHGISPQYPADLQNEFIPFLRSTEQETKLRIIQPLYQPALLYNKKMKTNLSEMQQEKINAFKRVLIVDIKSAYFNYLKTIKIKELLIDTRALLEEHLRINESLFTNQMATEEVVFRSKADLSRLDKQMTEAEKNIVLARAYFNYLLNRPLEADILADINEESLFPETIVLTDLVREALQHRNEFAQLNNAIAAAGNGVKLYGTESLPKVTLVFDYGIQGDTYRLGKDDDFWMASFLMSWNIFNGYQDKARKTQAILEKNKLEKQAADLENKIKLQVHEAYQNLLVARETLKSTEETMNSTKETFYIVSRKYEEGMVPQIEHIQARNEDIAAKVQHIIAQFDYRIAEAQLEQAIASYELR